MQTPAAPLLKDIHLPDAISWWPLAPGWWVLMLCILALLCLLFVLIRAVRRYRHKRQPYRQASQVLLKIRATFVLDQDKMHLLQQLSALLRQVAISYFGRTQVAGLTGQHWLQFLDTHLPGQHFTQGDGRVFAVLPYEVSAQTLDAEKTLALVQHWLRATRNGI